MKIPIIDQFFPYRCLICNQVVSSSKQIVCIPCIQKLPFNHWNILFENPVFNQINNLIPIEGASALLQFKSKNESQKLLHALKFFNQPQIGIFLGELASEELKNLYFKAILPVPVHKKTLRKRNYNQVLSFAQTIGNNLGVKVVENSLIRKKKKKTQIFKDKRHRLEQLENSFQFTPYPKMRTCDKILLVDDLCTTGATIRNCCLAIKRKIPCKIYIYTMAAVI